nr:DUF6478 family protein [Limimaricola sp. G21655-S1]
MRQPGADWAWRPGPWGGAVGSTDPVANATDLGCNVRLFHDAAQGEVWLDRGTDDTGAMHPLQLGLDGFDGGFLSLAIALPKGTLAGLERRHLLGLDLAWTARDMPRAYARLNLKQGPNSETLLRDLPRDGVSGTEFDLWPLGIEPERVDTGWIDLIFEAPLPTRIEIRDLVVARRPRAGL